MRLSHWNPYLFPSDHNSSGYQGTLKTTGEAKLRRAKGQHFRLYDPRSTCATRLRAGGVADEWVTQMLRQGDAQVFKKYWQMKLEMKREALEKLNRRANEMSAQEAGDQKCTVLVQRMHQCTVSARSRRKIMVSRWNDVGKYFRINSASHVGA
jgi:hypothetical protein